jgi:hypothetical protein
VCCVDIIEKILGDSIVDETDAFIDNSQKIKVQRAESFEWARLRLLDSKIVDGMLSRSEAQAVTAHLRMNYTDTVKLLTDTQLTRFVTNTPVTQLDAATQELGKELPDDLIYAKGVPIDCCTLILSGKITILVGSENFRSDLSSWSVLGKTALENPSYAPDFSAFVSDGPCRCLRFKHAAFVEAVDASAVERRMAETNLAAGLAVSSVVEMEETSIGETLSLGSADAVPNRREKLIARIFKRDNINARMDETETEQPKADKTTVVRFKEFKEGGIFENARSSGDAVGNTPDEDEKDHKNDEVPESKPN